MSDTNAKTGGVTICADAVKPSKEVIEYLSKEIETTTTNMMLFRSKIAFAVFLGPFLLLLAVVANTKGANISLKLGTVSTFIIAGIWGLCFLVLGYMNARIERQAWLQCNKWRQLIAEIHNDPSASIEVADLQDNLYENKWRSKGAYVLAYAVLLTSFTMSIMIIFHLRAVESQPQKDSSSQQQKG